MATKSEIHLREVATDSNRPAEFWDKILERHVKDIETLWADSLKFLTAPVLSPRQESAHWNWRGKVTSMSETFGYRSFAIECDSQTQGVMIANVTGESRLDATKGNPLVYVDYIETAPWNRRALGTPRFLGVGTVMMAAAIQLSREEGYQGRIGLHSLPQSEGWYSNRGMVCLGADRFNDKRSARHKSMTWMVLQSVVKSV